MDNNKKNKIILAVVAAVIVAAIVIAAVVSGGSDKKSSNISDNQQTQQTQAPKVTPTFMYFVSKADAAYNEEMAMIEELKAEYGEKVNFDIKDVDEDTTIAENFAFVPGNTPALIMLNTANDISAIQMQCADKATLKAEIDKALE